MAKSFWDLPGVMPRKPRNPKGKGRGPTHAQVMNLRRHRIYATRREALDFAAELDDYAGKYDSFHDVYPETHYGRTFYAVH